MELDPAQPMPRAGDLINSYFYPVLATFAVNYGAIQIARIASQARHYNTYIDELIISFEKD